ncbi:nucleotidyltransferase family protein [Hyphobacterium sp. CCMP332]|uniref:nucleotidyltransferase family protein n=1 Tax=Hyphobacterium sp. CCMP332 TaxID=2749086 RepID=UPI0016508494|nr:nucleotidyltransferase family protein [Hyphobacterium sp. CCMP332]QNL20106.1 nucleotidyltransferase family protein [Hyphobacterium sp. CCMP332]
MITIETGMALAAGLGTRMRPLTLTRPKALVEVNGKPLLDHVLDRFADVGVSSAVVNIHHFADQMRDHLSQRADPPALRISDESELVLETGGGLVKARPLLGDDPVFVSNIDALWAEGETAELDRLRAAWTGDEMDALLLLARREDTLGYGGAGDFFLEAEGRVRRRGSADSAPYVFAGTQILNPAVIDGYREEAFSLNRIWDALLAKGRVHGLVMDAFWMHVGDPDARDAAEGRLT